MITIQNITRKEYENLKRTNQFIATNYEESGFQISKEAVHENEVFNPILFKGHVFRPVDEESFTGVSEISSGQVTWTQVKMVDRETMKRSKRDSFTKSESVHKLEFLFKEMMKLDDVDECKNQRGAVVIINVNVDEHPNVRDDLSRVLGDIYTKVMCRRSKKILITGNLGWVQSYNVIKNFRRRSNFFQRNGMTSQNMESDVMWNVNQIWSRDFQGILGTSVDLFDYEGVDMKRKIARRPNAAIAPAFAAFHYPIVRKLK